MRTDLQEADGTAADARGEAMQLPVDGTNRHVGCVPTRDAEEDDRWARHARPRTRIMEK
jgi:hypothetical protein